MHANCCTDEGKSQTHCWDILWDSKYVLFSLKSMLLNTFLSEYFLFLQTKGPYTCQSLCFFFVNLLYKEVAFKWEVQFFYSWSTNMHSTKIDLNFLYRMCCYPPGYWLVWSLQGFCKDWGHSEVNTDIFLSVFHCPSARRLGHRIRQSGCLWERTQTWSFLLGLAYVFGSLCVQTYT